MFFVCQKERSIKESEFIVHAFAYYMVPSQTHTHMWRAEYSSAVLYSTQSIDQVYINLLIYLNCWCNYKSPIEIKFNKQSVLISWREKNSQTLKLVEKIIFLLICVICALSVHLLQSYNTKYCLRHIKIVRIRHDYRKKLISTDFISKL